MEFAEGDFCFLFSRINCDDTSFSAYIGIIRERTKRTKLYYAFFCIFFPSFFSSNTLNVLYFSCLSCILQDKNFLNVRTFNLYR